MDHVLVGGFKKLDVVLSATFMIVIGGLVIKGFSALSSPLELVVFNKKSSGSSHKFGI